MSRIDFYSSAPARDRLISLVSSGHKARHVRHFTVVIAQAAWAVLVRAVRCTGILPAQHDDDILMHWQVGEFSGIGDLVSAYIIIKSVSKCHQRSRKTRSTTVFWKTVFLSREGCDCIMLRLRSLLCTYYRNCAFNRVKAS